MRKKQKNEKRRISVLSSIVLMILIMVFCFTSCKDITGVIKEPLRDLDTPANLRIEGTELCWNPVENASRYLVSINGKEYYSDNNSYSLAGVKDGDYVFKVKAIGDSVVYESSQFSLECKATFYNGERANGGYYSQFDDLTKNESFLGYGFDVIRSSVFSDKYVKTSYPLFNHDDLMNQRLLKVDSKYVHVDEIQSKDMDEFMSDWNVNANVNVSWGKKKVGGSVGLEAAYSGGTEKTRSKYFHCLTFSNQEFYIVMQSDIATLRSILSSGFKSDLYSDVEPSVLFDRYGTHFITSAVMGGKINSYYLYTSDEEKDFHDISAKVSTQVRYMAGKTDVSVSGDYRTEAKSQNIDIKNTLEVIGGSDFGMMSDADITANYAAWEKSLENHASLMGIKDTGSLRPVWELLDPALDKNTYSWDYDGDGKYETGNRSAQLQAYFYHYGTDSYNDLMEAAALPELVAPTEITSVLVNNEPANEKGEYVVYAGVENTIAFNVLPTNAVGYTKTISLASPNEFVSINDKNQLVIEADIPQNETLLTIVLSAGEVKKQINVRVIKTYTVDFYTNAPGYELDSLHNVKHGSQINEPSLPQREGYKFAGWYTSSDFTEGSKYEFGSNAIVGHTTLYAKWENVYPIVYLISNIDSTTTELIVNFNTAIADLDITAPEGYVFGGCFKDVNLVDPYEGTETISGNITVFVKWVPKKYTVSFNTLGGSAVESQSISHGELAVMPATPTKAGYTFEGWYSDSKYENSFDFYLNTITEAKTLYAKWVEFNPTVTVKSNVEYEGVYQWSEMIGYEKKLSVVKVPDIYGYNFIGYYTSDLLLNEVDANTVITEDVTVYAKYEKKVYTVSFDTEGGSAVEVQSVTHGLRASEPEDPSKEGYTFLGWYTDIDFATEFDFSRTKIESTTVIYAKWERFYPTVSYVSDIEGYTGSSSEVSYGAVLTEPAAPTLRGYTFAGWYSDAKMLTEFDFASQIKTDTVIYVKWQINSYTVTFESDGGSAIAPQTVTFGSKVTKPATPTKEGYNFVAWNKVDGTKFDFSSMLIDENITLYAEWTVEPQVIISFDSMGGSSHDAQNVYINRALGEDLPVPTKEGYSFVAWYKSTQMLDTDRVYANTTFAENTVLYAKWTANSYKVTLNTMGGSATQETLDGVIFAAKYGTLPQATKTGYTFGGWYTKEAGGNLVTADTVVNIADDHTLYARWTANTFIIVYNGNGSTGGSTASTTHTYDVSAALRANGFTKTGYTFTGWNTKADGKGTSYQNSASIKNLSAVNGTSITLYAQWKANGFIVVYNGNGATGGSTASTNHTYDVSAALRANGFTKTGYTFAGWNTKADGKGTSYQNSASVKNLTSVSGSTVTLYAQWKANGFIIIYNGNGATGGSTASTNHTYDVSAALRANGFTKTGYTFDSWNTKADGTGTKYTNGQAVKNLTAASGATVNLYARWKANTYTVKYNGNGATGGTIANSSHTYDVSKALTANAFYKTGYTFAGWNTKADGTGTKYTNGQSVRNLTSAVNGTVTLYAQWTANTYTVKYNGNGSTGGTVANSTHTYNAAKALTANAFYKNGYTFAGWNTQPDGKGVDYGNKASVKNLTSAAGGTVQLYAMWEVNPYEISKYVTTTGSEVWNTKKTVKYTVYTTIDSTPFTLTGNVVIDWRGETETNMLNHTSRAVPNSIYNNIDISNTTKSVYFIGDSEKTFTNLRLSLVNFKGAQAVKLSFINFNYVSNDIAIRTWNDNGETANLVNLTIEVKGTSSISTTANGKTAINIQGIINLNGEKLNVTAANGKGGSNGGEGANGKAGTSGGHGIAAEKVYVNMDELVITAGNGGSGGNGGGNVYGYGGDGGNGGDGGHAIFASTIELNCDYAKLTGGNGANGGKGGDDTSWTGEKDGDGGDGGDGGYALSPDASVKINITNGILVGGTGGSGGSGRDNGSKGSAGADASPKAEIISNKKRYAAYQESKTWEEAKVAAVTLGGHLVTITNANEYAIVKELLGYTTWNDFYIGAYRATDDQNVWAWVTGEKFDYAVWNSGEPNNTNNKEDYVGIMIDYGGGYNDYPGDQKHGYIVEYD
ncbi:MAG: InlB B-repeat-containing protein [Clostridia bacterium]|nr:InlB B-repeat-containing protein [Clostridia bacterium]